VLLVALWAACGSKRLLVVLGGCWALSGPLVAPGDSLKLSRLMIALGGC